MAVWQHGTELSIFMTGFGLDSYDCQMTLLEAAIFHCVWRFHGCGDALGSGSRKKILMTSLSMARVGQISSAGWGKSIQCCLLYICRNKTYPKVMKQVDITGSLSIYLYTPHTYIYTYMFMYIQYIQYIQYISIYLSLSIRPNSCFGHPVEPDVRTLVKRYACCKGHLDDPGCRRCQHQAELEDAKTIDPLGA